MKFYDAEYRPIYSGQFAETADFFQDQKRRGSVLLALLKTIIDFKEIQKVFEVGCGAGGILLPFSEAGKEISGCDYGEQYLQYGRDLGMQLYHGDVSTSGINIESQDLIILSHVMEHFQTPVQSIIELLRYIKPGGYLLLEVPGIMNIYRVYFRPILYFQNAHVFNFHSKFLGAFLGSLGLEILYGDEKALFLCRKPINLREQTPANVRMKDLERYSWKILINLLALRYFWWINPYWLVACLRRRTL
jgi:2-polyprenyl-3-methyl-5-hydroxy-6-metoxy-1,4-benzoquinol methylase